MARLDEMICAWEKRQPRRAAGARWALAGFCYQFNESLLRFFEPIKDGQRPEVAAFDRLGDYATQDDEKIEFVQHKRILRKSSYLEALGEFLTIESFLHEHFPDDRARVEYRIVTSSLVAGFDISHPPQLADVRSARAWQQIAESRFLDVQVRSDPWYELLKLFWPRVRHPGDLITKCVGYVFKAVASDRSAESLRESLVEAYETDRIEDDGTSSPWLDPGDITPEPAGVGTVLTGERPTLQDWRDGCFMRRDAYVDRIAQDLQSILRPSDSVRRSRRGRVPVLWITGGSGVGKSGLLWASLERVVRDEGIHCAWVRGSPHELLETLKKTHQERVIFGIDDLYAPPWRETGQWELLAPVVRARRDALIWIASAPTEYVTAFKQQQALNDVFEHKEIKVKPLTEGEQRAYAQWYVQRTNADPETITVERGDRNFLLASLRYQIRSRNAVSLEEFTNRLWGRLQELGIEETMAAALAAIRLGISAPISLFDDPRSLDGLTKLDQDWLFPIRTEKQPDGSLIRRISTHRQLAQQLYTERFPDDWTHLRASHLLIFWKKVNTPARQALIDVLGKKDRPVEEKLAFAVLVSLGKELTCVHPSAELFAQLHAWEVCAKQRKLPAADRRDALDWLCRLVVTPESIAPELMGCAYDLCWPLLVEPDTETARTLPIAARRWLEGHLDAERWSQVWHRIWEQSKDPPLIDLARRWLASHRDHIGWTHVFQSVFAAGLREPWLAEEAHAALQVLPANRVEHHLMPKVAKLPGLREHVGELWVGRLVLQTNEYLAGHCRKHLAELGCEPSVDWVELVTDRHANAVGAGTTLYFVLSQLERKRLTTDQYHRISKAISGWLANREDNPGWNYAWQGLIKVVPPDHSERDGLLRTGLTWLANREDKPEWNYVWQRLIEVLPPDHSERDGLVRTGLTWLANREDKPEWAHVWQHLIRALPPDDSERDGFGLLRTGLTWLTDREDKPEWSYVWRCLIEVLPPKHSKRDGLLSTGLAWLANREDKPEWNYVWRKLISSAPLSLELRRSLSAAGRLWLETHPQHPGYPAVRRALREFGA